MKPPGVATLLLAAVPALAAAQVPSDTAARDSAATLPVVRVGAPRIAGTSATAPYALGVRTAESLPQGTPSMALDEALRTMPGIQVDNRFNYALGERIAIRGAGARAQFGVRGVRVLIDGLPATLPDGQTALNSVDLATLDRVEVVRGPVASLYGNAAGGALLLETRDPASASLAAHAGVTGGSDGFLRTFAGAGGTRGAVRLGATLSRVAYGGFRKHSTAENHYGSARATWLGDRDLVRLTFRVVDYDALNPGSLSDSLLRLDRRQAFQNNVAQRTGERGEQQQAGVQWHRSAGDDEALEVTVWALAREIDNPIPGRVIAVDRAAGGARALLRGTAGALAWSTGLEHDRQRDDRQNYANVSGDQGALLLDQLEHVTASGAFAQLSVRLHPRLRVQGGARHDRTRFRAEDRLVTDDPDDSGERVLRATSPSGGLSLLLGRGVVAYANAGSAFETPTTTELANRVDGAGGFNPALAPQRTVSYEVGARRDGQRLDVQLAAFRALVRDALIPFEVPDVPGRQFFRNAGQTGTSGVEAGMSVRATSRLRVDAAYTYTDARFRRYTVETTSYEGNAVPGIGPHRADLAVAYAVRGGVVGGDVRHQSRTAVNDANTAHSGAYTVADLRLTSGLVRAGRVRLRAAGGVQNILAARYNSSVVVNAFGRRFYEPAPGRTFHVGATVEGAHR